MKISVTELENLTHKAIVHYGYTEKEAAVIKDVLFYAQLRGNNQGVVKLVGKGMPKRDGASDPTIIKELPVSALFDGNKTHAMIVMSMMTDVAIEKVRKNGMAIIGNCNTSESTGALGYYVSKIAQEGYIGIAYASAPFQTTAPYGSTEALFCTNPVAYGIPTEHEPIVLDMTTSAMAYYGLIEADLAHKKVSDQIGYDKDGNPTGDPAAIMGGALRTFGGHRGSGLALIGQIFAGALVQADSFNSGGTNAGNLIMAINPEALTTKEMFEQEVSSIVERIKSARKEDGVEEIFIPGERGDKYKKNVLESQQIEVEENLLQELRKIAESS